MAHHAQPADKREQLDGTADRFFNRWQIAALGIAVVKIQIAAHDQFAAIRLTDVKMTGAIRDDGIDHRLHRLADEGLQ